MAKVIITGGSLEVEEVEGEDAIALVAINETSKLKIRLVLELSEVDSLVAEIGTVGAAIMERILARKVG